MMSDIDRNLQCGYIRTHAPADRPRFLDVAHASKDYSFFLETAHLTERRTSLGLKPKEHAHLVYHLILFTEGRNHFQLQGQSVPCRPGTIALTSPGEFHDFGPLEAGELSYHEITFTLDPGDNPLTLPFYQLLEYYTGAPLSKRSFPLVLKKESFRRLERLFIRLISGLTQAGPVNWFDLYRTILDMFFLVRKEIYTSSNSSIGAEDDPLEAIKEHISRHYTMSIHLSDLAKRIHRSQEHVCRSFKKRYGVSPLTYQHSLRILAAERLLRFTNKSCKEIASDLGFADVYCFSKAFRKTRNCCPTYFRKSQPTIS